MLIYCGIDMHISVDHSLMALELKLEQLKHP
jgi:hypothetical protein